MRRTRHGPQHGRIAGGQIPLISLIQALTVAEYLNFRHAANALGVSQSSVSTRIKALEETLGILLLGLSKEPSLRRSILASRLEK